MDGKGEIAKQWELPSRSSGREINAVASGQNYVRRPARTRFVDVSLEFGAVAEVVGWRLRSTVLITFLDIPLRAVRES